MTSLRLDRYLSNATELSRSQAQREIRAGAVRVDGVPVTDPSAHVTAAAHIEYDGKPVALAGPRYLMLHKPVGYVCASHDRLHRTVFELVAAPTPLHIAGRLDIDTTGLVLLTDDGAWLHRVTSPRHEVPKVYRATLAEALDENAADMLRGGIQLKDEPRRCEPAVMEKISEREWRMTITEGKYHQVKRMLAAVGNNVTALHRERIGTLALDPALSPGQWRVLSPEEIASF